MHGSNQDRRRRVQFAIPGNYLLRALQKRSYKRNRGVLPVRCQCGWRTESTLLEGGVPLLDPAISGAIPLLKPTRPREHSVCLCLDVCALSWAIDRAVVNLAASLFTDPLFLILWEFV